MSTFNEDDTLSWDDLADFYHKKTGRHARVMPMDTIYEWAARQGEIIVNEDTSLSFKQPDPAPSRSEA